MRFNIAIYTILYTLLLHTISHSQTNKTKGLPPDWSAIELEVTNPSSEYFYPRIFERYKAADTTLTAKDYYYLYYGYTTQQGYKPLLPNPTADSLEKLFGKRTSPSIQTYEKAATLAEKTLEIEPFNLRDINVLAYAMDKLGYIEQAARQMRKIKMLEQAIKSTGTGLTEGSPWYIIYRNHALDIAGLMGLNVSNRIIVSTTVEFLQVQNMPDKQYKGLYFNYSEIYKRRPDYLDGQPKQKRRMEINGTQPWDLKKN